MVLTQWWWVTAVHWYIQPYFTLYLVVLRRPQTDNRKKQKLITVKCIGASTNGHHARSSFCLQNKCHCSSSTSPVQGAQSPGQAFEAGTGAGAARVSRSPGFAPNSESPFPTARSLSSTTVPPQDRFVWFTTLSPLSGAEILGLEPSAPPCPSTPGPPIPGRVVQVRELQAREALAVPG